MSMLIEWVWVEMNEDVIWIFMKVIGSGVGMKGGRIRKYVKGG